MARINWTTEELQAVIDEIVTGSRLIEVESKIETLDILFRYPTRKDIRNADLQMKRTFAKAIKDKFLTEAQILQIIEERNIWTQEDQEKVDELREKVQKWKDKLKNPDLAPRAIEQITEAIPKFEEQVFEAEYKKEIMLSNSAERKARQSKYEYLVWSCSFDPETEERVWSNYLTYCRVMDTKLKGNLLSEFLKYLGGRTITEIRFIARSALWRINYVVAQKTNTPLFPVAVVDLTPDQANVAWWTGYYESIWSMLPEDQPDDATIQNDEALDEYMENLHKERTRERQDAKKAKGNPFGAKSARNMKEQLIFRSNPEYMDLQYDELPMPVTQEQGNDFREEGKAAERYKKSKFSGSKRYRRPQD